ncbi:MAG: tetratricopeptide repeat protein [Hyphomicrobiaceae bacterium]
MASLYLVQGIAAALAVLGLSLAAPTGSRAETNRWQQRIAPAKRDNMQSGTKAAKVKSQPVTPRTREIKWLSPGEGVGHLPTKPFLPSVPRQVSGGNDPAYDAFEQGRYLTALSIAAKNAAKGEPQAFTLVARIHAEGLGVPQNYGLAAQWYQRAADLGDKEALLSLGLLYLRGQGVKKDIAKGADLIEKSAAQQQPEACYNLALLFLAGEGKPENPIHGFQLMQFAAEHGVVAAMYDLGTLYATGTGTDANAFKAAHWIGQAASKGLADAQLDEAIILFRGKGTPPDPRRAVQLLKSAADKGMPVAQNRLAHAYAAGLGARTNLIAAAKWHLIAKASGLDDPKLDAVVKKLSPADRLKAERAAFEWREDVLLQ